MYINRQGITLYVFGDWKGRQYKYNAYQAFVEPHFTGACVKKVTMILDGVYYEKFIRTTRKDLRDMAAHQEARSAAWRLRQQQQQQQPVAVVAALPAISHEECPMCYEPDTIWHGTIAPKCGHRSCMSCFMKWVQQGGNSCPICRTHY